jgi:surfeit locus 1 family protein
VNRSLAAFIALAVLLAALFVRLGLWQLDRRSERRARNSDLAARLAQPLVPFEHLRDDRSYRRAIVSGTADSRNEIVWTGRSRNGSPGVYILTPIRQRGNDTAVLVVRGWVYAPDASTVDLPRWREDRTTYQGYLLALPATSTAAEPRARERKLRHVSASGVQALLPYPAAAHYLVSQDSAPDSSPARLPLLTLDEGPHLSYAVQWFAFALIALGGATAIVLRTRSSRQASGSTGA